MGYIGEPEKIRRLNLEPLEVPDAEPVREPAAPAEPVAVPA